MFYKISVTINLPEPATLLKRGSAAGAFRKLCEILTTPFYRIPLGRLLLDPVIYQTIGQKQKKITFFPTAINRNSFSRKLKDISASVRLLFPSVRVTQLAVSLC